MTSPAMANRVRWSSAWLDGVAFAVGLGCAWWFGWQTTDLVWSLWLSSLVVGYATLVWVIARKTVDIGGGVWRAPDASFGARALITAIASGGGLFTLAFFTIHFGGFHFVHSVFLGQFFPLEHHVPSVAAYAEVFRNYWYFLPAAFLAHRAPFQRRDDGPVDLAVTPQAIAARKAKGDAMFEPYKNVIRMHLLIFFFAFAHGVHLAGVWIYAVAYAVYFFPWRLLKRP